MSGGARSLRYRALRLSVRPAACYPSWGRVLEPRGLGGAHEALQRWRATLPGGQTLFEIPAALVTCGDFDRATSLLRQRPLSGAVLCP